MNVSKLHLLLTATLTAALVLPLSGCGLVPTPLDAPQEHGNGGDSDTDGGLTVDEFMPSEGASKDVFYMEQDFNTEEYDAIEETGFISVKNRPLSTVSADVDTASYCNLRRMIRDGYRVAGTAAEPGPSKEELPEEDEWWYYEDSYEIPTGAVRIEEMLNYFGYDYETPTGKELFAATAHAGVCPWNKDTRLLVLGFATAPEKASTTKGGSNLVFLIDVSGSMDSPEKLDLLKESFDELVDNLNENDRISIVTYSGEEEVVLEGVAGNEHRTIMKAVRGLEAEGSTNGEAGLKMAYKLAEENFIEGGVNRIVMASDGDLNVGMTSTSELHDFVEKKRESGVYLSVLGFGTGNYKDNKMETLADHGNGSYHYIDSIEEADRVFGERLSANLVPFADDVKVQVEFNPAQIKGYRLIGYENRQLADEDFTNDEKDAGDVGPSSQFTLAYEIVPQDSSYEIVEPVLKYSEKVEPSKAESFADEWVQIGLRYRAFATDKVEHQDFTIKKDCFSTKPGKDWNLAAGVIELGMVLRNSEYQGTSTLESARKLVEKSGDDEFRSELVELIETLEANSEE